MNVSVHMHTLANLKSLAAVRNFIESTTKSWNCSSETITDMIIVVNEVVTNIIQHGYKGQSGSIEIEMVKDEDAIRVHIRDQALNFDPTLVSPPNLSLPLERRSLGGMGVYLVRQLTDQMIYRSVKEGGNELILIKKIARRL